MKLIVGLGNPGRKYEYTRHNMGFLVLDSFAKKFGVSITKEKFNGLYEILSINGEKVLLLKPLSFMNLSGIVVRKFVNFYKIDIDDVLVISDDLDMDFLKIKLKYKGSCGGHNGLRSIEDNLGTSMYKRLKIGISNDKSIDTKDYVLGKFSDIDMSGLKSLFSVTDILLEDYIKFDFNVLMSKYN